jgi:hypothetical protein
MRKLKVASLVVIPVVLFLALAAWLLPPRWRANVVSKKALPSTVAPCMWTYDPNDKSQCQDHCPPYYAPGGPLAYPDSGYYCCPKGYNLEKSGKMFVCRR